MGDIVLVVRWATITLQVLVVLFLLIKFKQHKLSLFFGGKNQIQSPKDNELHSCFIAALCTAVFFIIGMVLSNQVLALNLDKLELRRVYYFIMSMNSCAYSVAIYFLHFIRKCTFSSAAKCCLYLSVATVLLCIMQLVARGIFDYNGLSTLFQVTLLVVNATALFVVALYPLKLIKQSRQNAKEA
ncbi:hypothetical protein L1077_23135 [Pseudoalteromonas luteoviolacea]|uniref:hypothetical protein n=1 Tax=Pseudoalteromonas luteoviolacea TaxID=43657 RepID=UPI001F361624|nr:hypothetical protein [Pseudoalteromonas luteoviolacea]MCF6442325.1 hypothetical protein [Pseudoalteromonas luteoviolacea]